MNSLAKQNLIINQEDSQTLQELKRECNKLIDRFNLLEQPLGETGQQLTLQINDLLSVMERLKHASYPNKR